MIVSGAGAGAGAAAAAAADTMEVADARATSHGGFSIPIVLKEKGHHQEEEEIHLHLLKQLLTPFILVPGDDPVLREWMHAKPTRGKERDSAPPRRCHRLFRIKLSVRRGQALWSHKETPRFSAERESGGPLRLVRLVADGSRLELEDDGGQVGALSFFRLKPSQSGLSGKGETLDRDSVPMRVVAVIRRFPGPGGDCIALISKLWSARLGVRLHDKLFLLPPGNATVTITFSERWFRVPSKWSEQKLYTRVGHDFVNITATLEELARTLYQMYEQEEQEKMILSKKQEQERRRQEELNRKSDELEMKPMAYIPLGHGDIKWESSDEAMLRRFELSLGTNREVFCNFVEQECPQDMRWRLACYDRFVLPLTTVELQVVGFVEGYLDPKTFDFIEQRGQTETLRAVAMVSVSPQVDQILSFKFLADNLAIRLNDGTILTGWTGITVSIHCGDDDDDDNSCTFLSCTSAESSTHQILEWKNDGKNPIPCSCLLVQLNRKLRQVNATMTSREEQDFGLSSIFASEAEEDQGLLYHHMQQENDDLRHNVLSLSGKLSVEGEGEGEYSLLFESPGESDWVKVSEPYVPKFPTDEEIRMREEWRKERLKLVMEPITQPVPEPRRGWNYFMCKPGSRSTRRAELPVREPFAGFHYWILSDKLESKLHPKRKLYPRLVCLEWCTCSPSRMLQVYTLEIIVADSLHSCKLDISGFVAIRDFRDEQRNYIFNREMDHPLTVQSQHGVLRLPTLSPRRAIDSNSDILLEFNLEMKRTGDGIDSYHELIQGVVEHPSLEGRRWSRVNELSILPCGNHSTPVMRLKLAMISKGVEATIELQALILPPEGIGLRCTARAGWIDDDIELFDGKYGGGDNTSLQFVVATELHGDMEIYLEGVFNGVSKAWCLGFVPKFHALFSQEVDFQFAQLSLTVAWSM
ncbi:uncharacterized protein LOC102701550 [Oryza brachyantha]|uniref:uncharacterized protein LOC102701550 n=1 Tax=Oryza brachyantha TaxID=4533 RepID=UPI001AD9E9AB|nr:uncharacterized protein LOC102701550 [Oryza brachyantha]